MDLFTHEARFRGDVLIKKFGRVKIVICGAGALGANLCDNLVRQGFRSIRVIDRDRVDPHNPATQPYGKRDVGIQKALVLKNRIFRDMEVSIDAEALELTQQNVGKLLLGFDLVVDTFDNPPSRGLVTKWCRDNNAHCLHAGMSGDGYSEAVWNERYLVPKDRGGPDPCDYPLARDLVIATVMLVTEAIIEFVAAGNKKNFAFTLKDKVVRTM